MIRKREQDRSEMSRGSRGSRASRLTLGLALRLPCVLALACAGCASSTPTSVGRTTELTSAAAQGPSGQADGREPSAPKVGKAERSFDLDDKSDDSVAPKRPTTSRHSGTFGNWK